MEKQAKEFECHLVGKRDSLKDYEQKKNITISVPKKYNSGSCTMDGMERR